MKTSLFFTATAFYFLLAKQLPAQTAGGSVVLASCGSYVQFSVNKGSPDFDIVNLCLNNASKYRWEFSGYGVNVIETVAATNNKGGFSNKGGVIKVTLLEKGCNNINSPKDSDIRVHIPAGAYNIKTYKLPSGSTCTQCGADFYPTKV